MDCFIFYAILFLIASFLGWILETIWSIISQRKIVNRGLVSGPFCILYGFSAVFFGVFLQELTGVWLFLFTMLWATLFEWISGHLMEGIFHQRLWDYSSYRFHIDGYVALLPSILWGILGFCTVRFLIPGTELLLSFVPKTISLVIAASLLGLLVLDMLACYFLLYKRGKNFDKWEAANQRFSQVSKNLSVYIEQRLHKRISHAYPSAKQIQNVGEIEKTKSFAKGLCYEKIFWLFMLGAFLGDITETIYCRITAGVWMSRSSVIWGPFSIVWGLAIALATILLYRYKDREDRKIFIIGAFLGGAYEYLCSVFTEICFGKVFWDYSEIPFNLGGRINLLYCFFWGIAAVVWLKNIYPYVSVWIEKIPLRVGKILTCIVTIFMIVNIIFSSLALVRYSERDEGILPSNRLELWLDQQYNDDIMEKIYPNALAVE